MAIYHKSNDFIHNNPIPKRRFDEKQLHLLLVLIKTNRTKPYDTN